MFSTNFIFRQQENLVANQKCLAGFRPLCNKILLINNINTLSRLYCCKKFLMKQETTSKGNVIV